MNANVGGTITGNVTVVGNLTSNTITTTGSNGSISGANAIFSNYVFEANGTVDLFIYANNAYTTANGAFAAANAATTTNITQNNSITVALNTANAAFIHANAAFNQANTGGGSADQFARNTANAAFIQANTPSHVANSAAIYANGAFAAANAATATNVTQNNNITVALNTGDAAFSKANDAYSLAETAYNLAVNFDTLALDIIDIQGVDVTQNNSINAAFLQANTPSHVANSAAIYANAAFIRANNSLDVNTGGIITGNLTVTQNLSVGNLFVTGQVVSINASTLVANDTLIILGAGNYASDLKDLGFAGHYNAGTNAHSGLIRDFGTKEWYLFKEYTPEIGGDNNININDASFTIDTLNANIRSTIVLSKGIDLLIRTNTIFDLANAAFIQANTPSHVANSAAIYANGAFAAANAATATDVTQNNSITVALNTSNAAFIHANAAYNQANTGGGGADQYARNTANAAFTVANAAITFTSSSTPPSSPSAGDQWYNTNNDILYEYINDGTSIYWVDITSSAITTSNVSITASGSADILNPFLLAGM